MEQHAVQELPAYIQMTQQEMELMLHAHLLWMRTDGAEGKRGNFRDVDLRGCSLAGAQFTGASLRGACLQGMDVRGAVFEDVDLAEAQLTGMNARGVSFQRANFSKAQADMAVFVEANLSHVTMLSADLSGADCSRAIMVQAAMRQASLSSATFEGANLSQAILRESNLTDANFSRANLEHADLRESVCTRTRLDGANLRETMLRGATLEGVSFIEADFSHAIDVAPHYQMVAFQQRQETLEEDKRVLARETERLTAKEEAVLAEKREIEKKLALLVSLKDQEQELQKEMVSQASKAKFFGYIWLLAVTVSGLGVAALAAGIPADKLNLVELALLFGVLLAVLLLFLVTAVLLMRAAGTIEKHGALRDRKYSLIYTEGMDRPDSALLSESPSASSSQESIRPSI